MAELTHNQARRDGADVAITKFNREIVNGIYLLNLDHAGANLETPFPLSPDYPVEFSFIPPGASMEIEVAGRVTLKRQLTALPKKYHLRVQFYAPRWDLAKLLCHN